MSGPLELDYIGLAESCSMARNSDNISSSSSVTVNEDDQNGSNFNLKETELRLGLPGSESPERKLAAPGVSPSGYPSPPPCSLRNLVSGAKRGFSDAINGSSREWVFPLSTGSVVDLGRATTKEAAPASQSSNPSLEKKPSVTEKATVPAAKAQVVGWPPVRSFRKNSLASNLSKKSDDDGKDKLGLDCSYVKVSMEGAPYLRKVNLKTYNNYMQLSLALEKMFSCFTIGRCSSGNEGRLVDSVEGSEYVLTYEDKDGDWMLVGDVPWEMFVNSCQKLRIIKGSEGIGPAPRAIEEFEKRN